MSMKIKYVGAHTGGVLLPGDVFVEHGATVEVGDDLGADLLGRVRDGSPQWEPAKPTKNTPTTPAPAEEN